VNNDKVKSKDVKAMDTGDTDMDAVKDKDSRHDRKHKRNKHRRHNNG
jgi:hypothetical protein